MKEYILKVKEALTTSRRNQENYKSLRANIDFIDENAKVLMVTSSIPGEGKSTVSLHLAAEYANNGNRVLFLDCDLRKSNFSRDFSIPVEQRSGLGDVLVKIDNVNDALFRTDIDNLMFMVSGTVRQNATELLQSVRFTNLLSSFKKVFDYIILDMPPVGSVIDAAVVAKRADGVVYVIESEEISYRLASKGLKQLELSGAKIFGTVLNGIKASNRAMIGTYGVSKYGYDSYSSYYGEE